MNYFNSTILVRTVITREGEQCFNTGLAPNAVYWQDANTGTSFLLARYTTAFQVELYVIFDVGTSKALFTEGLEGVIEIYSDS